MPAITPVPFIVVVGDPYTLRQVSESISLSAGDRPSALGGSGTAPCAVVSDAGVRAPLPKSPEPGDPGHDARTAVTVDVAFLVPGHPEGGKVDEVRRISLVYRDRVDELTYYAPGMLTCSKVTLGLIVGKLTGPLMVYGSAPDDVRGVGGATVLQFLGDEGTLDPGTSADSFYPPYTQLAKRSNDI